MLLIFIYLKVCACVCVCAHACMQRQRERSNEEWGEKGRGNLSSICWFTFQKPTIALLDLDHV